jgi:hypothetical protein
VFSTQVVVKLQQGQGSGLQSLVALQKFPVARERQQRASITRKACGIMQDRGWQLDRIFYRYKELHFKFICSNNPAT